MSKYLNPNLQRVIRVLKNSGDTLDDIGISHLADITGTNRHYIQRNKPRIHAYYDVASVPTDSDVRFFENRSIDAYIDIALKSAVEYPYRDMLGAIVGYLMKREYKMLGHIQKNTKVIGTGKAVIDLICTINSRKDTSNGTPINSQSKAVKYLFKSNKVSFVDELFKRTDGYFAGNVSKRWKLTPLTEDIL